MGRPLNQTDLNKTAELYNERYKALGRSIETVGWGSTLDQKLRFEMLFRSLNPRGKTILDVGCGLGDMVNFLDEKTDGDFKYIGIDIAGKLIEDAKDVFKHEKVSFFNGEIFSVELPQVDIAVLSGALSFKTDNIEIYAMSTMKKMFELSREAISLNFLSKYVDFELEKNQHYHPETVFSQAKSITKNVALYHDYPLFEFTVQMKKTS